MVRVSILGSTGYTGAELVRILSTHPFCELTYLGSQSYAGQSFTDVFSHLHGLVDKECGEHDVDQAVAASDVIFVALPHGHSAPVVGEAVSRGRKVIDLGADFRFRDPRIYEQWYGVKHGQPSLLDRAVYGLPELRRPEVKGAEIVANPGCYPTGAVLALAPLLAEELIWPDSIIIDSKSGVSGAGRGLALSSMFSEVNESVHPYGVVTHRHTPEIEQELTRLAGEQVKVTFTPHLIPMTRGILTTVYASLKKDVSMPELRDAYRCFYAREIFVRILPAGCWPRTKWVWGSNYIDIGLTVDERTGRVIVVSAIDNLVKGASGQAVQNMNIMFELPEDTGLGMAPLFP